MDVAATLRRVVDGDQRAWDEIVDHFGGLVWSVARGYRLGSLTDDVVQTVWLRLAEYCDRIREPDRLAGWLATTTRNEALRVSRKQQRSVSIPTYQDRADPAVSFLDELATDDDTLNHVLDAFRKLPEHEQELLRLLCTVPPLDYATIAEMLDRSVGWIGPTRNRTLHKLRRMLPDGLIDDAPRKERSMTDEDSTVPADDVPAPDRQLLDLLSLALTTADPVPEHITSGAKAAFTWRNIDAELAEIVFDSTIELTGVRASESERQITFQAPGVEIEIMIVDEVSRRLVGQLVPPAELSIDLVGSDSVTTTRADHLGRFTFDDVAPGPIRMAVRNDDGGMVVQTDWVVL